MPNENGERFDRRDNIVRGSDGTVFKINSMNTKWPTEDLADRVVALMNVGGERVDTFEKIRREMAGAGLLSSARARERAPKLIFDYENHRGELSERTVIEPQIYFGQTEWHPRPQWLLRAFDLGKNESRDFALGDCKAFRTDDAD